MITDDQLNRGIVDPTTFERKVRQVWMRREKSATSYISMGNDWNVDLLDKLAAVPSPTYAYRRREGRGSVLQCRILEPLRCREYPVPRLPILKRGETCRERPAVGQRNVLRFWACRLREEAGDRDE